MSEPMSNAWSFLKNDDDDDEPEFEGLESLFGNTEELLADMRAEREQKEREHAESEKRMEDMDEGNARRPYAMHDSEELNRFLTDSYDLMEDPHEDIQGLEEERQMILDELRLRDVYSQRDIQNNVGYTLAENLFAGHEMPEGFNSMDSDERQSWQQKNASEPMDLAHRLLKTDIRFGDNQDEDDTNVHHLDLTHDTRKDPREAEYTSFPERHADWEARRPDEDDEDDDYSWGYDDYDYYEPYRLSDEKVGELDERDMDKVIQHLKNMDVNNAMWGAHGVNQSIIGMDEDKKDKLIEAAREQVKPGKLYSHDDWYKPVPLYDGKITGPHWFYPSDRAMARNLNPEWYDAKWSDGQFNPLALAPLDQKFRMPGREGEWSIQDLADEMKNKGDPFEIAYRLLKMPIVPGSVKTKDEDGVMSMHGQFLDDSHEDPEEHETMPIFADWTKPVEIPDSDPKDFATLGDIDIGIGSPGEEHERTDDTERRGKFQLAQLPGGSYIPGPSTHDTAISVPYKYRQKGYSRAMVEMLAGLLQHKDAAGQISINPFQDGFSSEGYKMMHGILQNKQMAGMLRQHFISQIPNNPGMIDNLNAMNHMLRGSNTNRNDYEDAIEDYQDTLRDQEDDIESDIHDIRAHRGDGEVA